MASDQSALKRTVSSDSPRDKGDRGDRSERDDRGDRSISISASQSMSLDRSMSQDHSFSFARPDSPMSSRRSTTSLTSAGSVADDVDMAALKRSDLIKGVIFCFLSTTALAFNTVAWEVLFDDSGAFATYFPPLPATSDALVTTLAVETALSLVVYAITKIVISVVTDACFRDKSKETKQKEREKEREKEKEKEKESAGGKQKLIAKEKEKVDTTKKWLEDGTSSVQTDAASPSPVDSASASASASASVTTTSSSSSSTSAPTSTTISTDSAIVIDSSDPRDLPQVSVLRYNTLAFLGAVLYFAGFATRLLGINYLSAVTFSQMEPARIVYLFVFKIVYLTCCFPKLSRGDCNNHKCMKDTAEAVAITLLEGDEQDGKAAAKRIFRFPVFLAMSVIFGALSFQMYATLSDDTEKRSSSDFLIGFTCLFVCLFLNALENVWWEIVALHPTIDTLAFLQRHDQYLLALSLVWALLLLPLKNGLWFESFASTIVIAGALNAVTVPAANSMESKSLEMIDSLSFSSIQELCYPFLTLLFSVCWNGSSTILPGLNSWIAMGLLGAGIILFHLVQTVCAPVHRDMFDDEVEDGSRSVEWDAEDSFFDANEENNNNNNNNNNNITDATGANDDDGRSDRLLSNEQPSAAQQGQKVYVKSSRGKDNADDAQRSGKKGARNNTSSDTSSSSSSSSSSTTTTSATDHIVVPTPKRAGQGQGQKSTGSTVNS